MGTLRFRIVSFARLTELVRCFVPQELAFENLCVVRALRRTRFSRIGAPALGADGAATGRSSGVITSSAETAPLMIFLLFVLFVPIVPRALRVAARLADGHREEPSLALALVRE